MPDCAGSVNKPVRISAAVKKKKGGIVPTVVKVSLKSLYSQYQIKSESV